jgi:hypothetical protein
MKVKTKTKTCGKIIPLRAFQSPTSFILPTREVPVIIRKIRHPVIGNSKDPPG